MDFDIVSDLNGDSDVLSANTGNVQVEGQDAVHVNAAVRGEVASQPKQVDDTPKAEDDKPRSLRDTISNALKADAAAATPANAQQGENRERDPVTGQFVEKPLVDPNAPPIIDPSAPAAPAAPVTAAPVGIDPQVFASLPAETQATLARTMEDVGRQQQRFAQLAPIEQLIAPRFDAWAMNGMSPQVALHQLLALSDFAGRDAPGFIKYMAQANNVNLEELVLGMDVDDPVDPQIATLQQQIAELQGARTQEQQQQQQTIHNRTVDEVIAFADEKDQSGNALRPYLSELGDNWLPYIGVVKTQNPQWPHSQVLQQAYENACWANPSVRGKMQKATDAAAEADRLRNEATRADAARTASATVRSGVPTSAPAAPNDPNRTTREVIRAAMAQHS